MEINGRLKINSMTGTSVSVVGYDANATITSGGTTITNLNNWSNFGQTGIVVQTATGAWSGRTITGPAAGITVTNGNGVAGNPTLSLNGDLNALENLASTGIAVRTGTNTWAQRTITAGAGITVTNGNGVSGNPTISLPASAVTNLNLWSAGTGTSSVRTGNNTTASSTASVAIGQGNVASGDGSFAGGFPGNAGNNNTIASGSSSFSFQEAYAQAFGLAAGVYSPKSTILGGQENLIVGAPNCGIFSSNFSRISGVTYNVTYSAIIGGSSHRVYNYSSVIIGGAGITTTDDNTVYVPNFKTTGFNQHSYVSVGAASTTLNKETAFVIGTISPIGGSVTITLPASPVNGQVISFRRTDALANTFTIAPNTGYTLRVAGTLGNYNLPTNSKIRLILVGTTWYDI